MKMLIHPIIMVNRALRRVEQVAVGLLLGALILLSLVQIAERVSWIDPILRHLTVWTGFIGASLATDEGKHITIDVLSHTLSAAMLRRLQIALDVISAATALVLTLASITFVRNEMEFSMGGEMLILPSWVLNTIYPWAFGMMAMRFLINALSTFSDKARVVHSGKTLVDSPRFS